MECTRRYVNEPAVSRIKAVIEIEPFETKTTVFFKKVGEHRSERNEITSSQLTDTGELIKIITDYCDKFLGNTQRNLM